MRSSKKTKKKIYRYFFTRFTLFRRFLYVKRYGSSRWRYYKILKASRTTVCALFVCRNLVTVIKIYI